MNLSNNSSSLSIGTQVGFVSKANCPVESRVIATGSKHMRPMHDTEDGSPLAGCSIAAAYA